MEREGEKDGKECARFNNILLGFELRRKGEMSKYKAESFSEKRIVETNFLNVLKARFLCSVFDLICFLKNTSVAVESAIRCP